jgi:hypothetical protein
MLVIAENLKRDNFTDTIPSRELRVIICPGLVDSQNEPMFSTSSPDLAKLYPHYLLSLAIT